MTITGARVAARALVIALFVASAAFAGSIDEEARRFVRLAYAGDFEHLPKSAGAATESFERMVRNTLHVRCVAVDAVVVRDVSPAGDTATVLLDVVLRKSETPERWGTPEMIPVRVELARERDSWRVARSALPDEELADQLVAASDEERRQPLRAHAGEIGPGVARAVYTRAIGLTNSSKGNLARATSLAHELALLSGDLRTDALALCIDAFVLSSGDKAAALLLTQRSLEIGQAFGDPDVLARAWYTRGRVVDAECERSECYRKALAFAERAEDRSMLVRVLYSMANIAANHDVDNLTARRYIDRILSITRETGGSPGNSSGDSRRSVSGRAGRKDDRGGARVSRARSGRPRLRLDHRGHRHRGGPRGARGRQRRSEGAILRRHLGRLHHRRPALARSRRSGRSAGGARARPRARSPRSSRTAAPARRPRRRQRTARSRYARNGISPNSAWPWRMRAPAGTLARRNWPRSFVHGATNTRRSSTASARDRSAAASHISR